MSIFSKTKIVVYKSILLKTFLAVKLFFTKSISIFSITNVIYFRGKGAQGFFSLDDLGYPGNLGESDLKRAMEFLDENRGKFSIAMDRLHLVSQNEHNSIAFGYYQIMRHL